MPHEGNETVWISANGECPGREGVTGRVRLAVWQHTDSRAPENNQSSDKPAKVRRSEYETDCWGVMQEYEFVRQAVESSLLLEFR